MSSIPSGRATLIIKDANGDVIYEGICSSYSMSVSRNGRTIKAEGMDLIPVVSLPNAIDFIPINISINDVGVTAAKCTHKWKLYQGLQEKYDYCETCGVKK